MRALTRVVVLAVLVSAAVSAAPAAAKPAREAKGSAGRPAIDVPEQSRRPVRHAPCVRGMAGEFPCDRVDLLSYFTMDEIGGGIAVGTGRGSGGWGWEDPVTRREYAIVGRENGTSFIDISDPKRPVYVANLPSASTQNVIWREIKVYRNHAFIVSEALNHGLQVLNLTQLRSIRRNDAPVTLSATARYMGFGRSHNIVINEKTGFAYALGTREGISCSSGMHMLNIRKPLNPTFVGCFAADGYIHDAQCVIYQGPDTRFRGREICFTSSPTPGPSHSVTIVDVTDKANPVILSVNTYANARYAHQGWLTEDQRYFLFGDELDEQAFGHNTNTMIWDVRDLTAARLIGTHFGPTTAIDHNMYVKNRFVYQSNYSAGLYILDLREVEKGRLKQVGYFDVYPPHNDAVFGFGTWGNYPYFRKGVVAVHGYQGVWFVKPRLGLKKP
jgi:choice-of-anchor B domain-containing protein